MENNKNPLVQMGALISIGIVLAAIIIGLTFYKIRSLDNTLSVTGSAKVEVVSDTVKWNTEISTLVKVPALSSGFTKMDTDREVVLAFLKEAGVSEDEITVSNISYYEVYEYNDYRPRNERDYQLTQYITINSKDIEKITELAKNTDTLIEKEVTFKTNSLEYYISNLPELRVTLLKDAIVDAEMRAESIASATGKGVGNLKSASSGVVQVLSRNSTEVADYGSYDTSNIEKEVMVTVKAVFTLR